MKNILKLPDFIIVGAQKAGTTAMHFSLANHSDVFVSASKEINFFNEDDNYSMGLEWYAAHFKDCPTGKTAGESTPEYLYEPKVAKRIALVVPDAKLIVLLRNPIGRAYSAYWHAVRYGYEHLSFEEAIETEPTRLNRSALHRRYNSYIDRGYYATQLKCLYEYFDRSRVHVVITEEYRSNRQQVLTDVADFLGINPNDHDFFSKQPSSYNSAKMPRYFKLQRLLPYLDRHFMVGAKILSRLNLTNNLYPSMSMDTRLHLRSIYKDSNDALEELICREIKPWWY